MTSLCHEMCYTFHICFTFSYMFHTWYVFHPFISDTFHTWNIYLHGQCFITDPYIRHGLKPVSITILSIVLRSIPHSELSEEYSLRILSHTWDIFVTNQEPISAYLPLISLPFLPLRNRVIPIVMNPAKMTICSIARIGHVLWQVSNVWPHPSGENGICSSSCIAISRFKGPLYDDEDDTNWWLHSTWSDVSVASDSLCSFLLLCKLSSCSSGLSTSTDSSPCFSMNDHVPLCLKVNRDEDYHLCHPCCHCKNASFVAGIQVQAFLGICLKVSSSR